MKKAPWIIIATLLIVIFLQRVWPPKQKPLNGSAVQTTYDTIHDTVPYPVTRYVPKVVYKDTGSTKWRTLKIDTLKILSEYYARHYYVDTLVNDSLVQIIVCDTISQNKIIFRKPIVKTYPVFIKETTTIQSPVILKTKLYVGIGIGRNPNQFGLTANLLYLTKKDHAYNLSYDLLNHDIYFSLYWKIRLK